TLLRHGEVGTAVRVDLADSACSLFDFDRIAELHDAEDRGGEAAVAWDDDLVYAVRVARTHIGDDRAAFRKGEGLDRRRSQRAALQGCNRVLSRCQWAGRAAGCWRRCGPDRWCGDGAAVVEQIVHGLDDVRDPNGIAVGGTLWAGR